jgi:hypothetical protein
MGLAVRLLLVLPDVVAIATPEYFPVEMPRIVAGHVFAVLRKLARETACWRAMPPNETTLHNAARLRAELFGALEGIGIEERGMRHAGWLRAD